MGLSTGKAVREVVEGGGVVEWLSLAAPDFNIQQLPWTTPRWEGRVETRWRGGCCCISLLDLPVLSYPLPSSAVHMLVSWFSCCSLIN